MATRKKKVVGEDAADSKSLNVTANGWPKINQGSHLTVKTFEDGRTELIWDDEALSRDVRNAILEYESANKVETEKPKKARKKK